MKYKPKIDLIDSNVTCVNIILIILLVALLLMENQCFMVIFWMTRVYDRGRGNLYIKILKIQYYKYYKEYDEDEVL